MNNLQRIDSNNVRKKIDNQKSVEILRVKTGKFKLKEEKEN